MADTQPKPKLTLGEKLSMIYVILKTLSSGFLKLILGPFRGSNTAKKLRQHVVLGMLRTLANTASVRQVQGMQPKFHDTYLAFAKQRGFQPEWETLPSGTKAYWFGDKKAEKCMIFFHGGGYNCPVTPAHLAFCHLASTKVPQLSVLMVAYTLAPHAVYPTQLQQATETLSHILSPPISHPPSKIILAGDSAGGNLALGVLAHLIHPHSSIPPINLQGSKIGGAVLMSPWASFTHTPSIKLNKQKDLIPLNRTGEWERNFLGGKPKDGWNEALCEAEEVGTEWWDGIKDVVEEVLITAGSEEVLVDSIRALGAKLKEKHPQVTLLVAEGEWHENPVQQFPKDESGVSRDAIIAFCTERV